jgi:hypothetical protein
MGYSPRVKTRGKENLKQQPCKTYVKCNPSSTRLLVCASVVQSHYQQIRTIEKYYYNLNQQMQRTVENITIILTNNYTELSKNTIII